MSTPLLALALAAMCALFSAVAVDTAQVIGMRNHAANEARRVVTTTLDACAVGEGSTRQCTPPPSCVAPRCAVCWSDGAIRADVSLDWSPVLLAGLAPANGRYALGLETVDVADLAGTTLPACT